MKRWLCSLAVLLALSASLLPLAAQSLADSAAWQRDLESWRATRDKQIAAPDGWLSLSGMSWLKTGFNSLGSDAAAQLRLPANAPARVGLLTVSGKTVQLLSPAGGFPAGLTIDGQPAREMAISTTDASPSVIALGSVNMVVMERAGRFVLRVKDSASAARTGFHGLNWYAADPHLVVLAEWVPYPTGRMADIPTALGQSLHLPTPGVARFTIGEWKVDLEAVMEDPLKRSLLFMLRDTTSTGTTYAGGRLLHTQIPDHGLDQPGTVALDFNRLENPPCAYTSYATCPLPQEKNRLQFEIEAGEKRFTP